MLPRNQYWKRSSPFFTAPASFVLDGEGKCRFSCVQLPSCVPPGVSGAAGCQVFTPRAHCSAARIAFSTLLVLFSHAENLFLRALAAKQKDKKRTTNHHRRERKRTRFSASVRNFAPLAERACVEHNAHYFAQNETGKIDSDSAHTSPCRERSEFAQYENRLFVLFQSNATKSVFIFLNVNTTCELKAARKCHDWFRQRRTWSVFYLKAVTQFRIVKKDPLMCQKEWVVSVKS